MIGRNGQNLLFGIMLAVFCFVIATALARPIFEITDNVRNAENLNCEADNLTTGNSATCVVVDLYLPAFIASIILVGLGYITFKAIGE